jgi:hypothetical protein
VVLVVTAAGCGGGKRAATTTVVTRTASPAAAAVCLNSDTFVVQATDTQITGSSPGGINFMVTFYKTPAAATAALAGRDPIYARTIAATVIDDSGNPPLHPGGKPMRLIHDDFATLRHCIELRRPG